MGKSKCKIKEKYNLPMTILLIVLAVVFYPSDLYISLF